MDPRVPPRGVKTTVPTMKCSAFTAYDSLNGDDLNYLKTNREKMLGKVVKGLRNTIRADHLRTIVIKKKYKVLLTRTRSLVETNHNLASELICKNISHKIKIGEVGK